MSPAARTATGHDPRAPRPKRTQREARTPRSGRLRLFPGYPSGGTGVSQRWRCVLANIRDSVPRPKHGPESTDAHIYFVKATGTDIERCTYNVTQRLAILDDTD